MTTNAAALRDLRWLDAVFSYELSGKHPWVPYFWSTIFVVIIAVAGSILGRLVHVPHTTILFLLAVLGAASIWGQGAALYCVALTAATSVFFFYPPIYSFRIAEPQDIVDLLVFIVVGVLTGQRTARFRAQAISAERRERETKDLHAFATRLADATSPVDVYRVVEGHLSEMLGRPAVLLMPVSENARSDLREIADARVADPVRKSASVFWQDVISGRLSWNAVGQAEEGAATWRFRCLKGTRGWWGVIAVKDASPASVETLRYRHLVPMLDEAVRSLERLGLAAALRTAQIRDQTERLREALINSISHDLRTPLASVLASATTLQNLDNIRSMPHVAPLVAAIGDEANQLNAFIENLLQFSRLQSGELEPRFELVELADIVNAAVERAKSRLRSHELRLQIAAGLPMLSLDLFLMQQSIVNLLENAAKYSPANTPIKVAAYRCQGEVWLDIVDVGAGLDRQELERVFDRFYRGQDHEALAGGTGLGLTICRAFVQANHGAVEALSAGPGLGSIFRVRLPVPHGETKVANAAGKR